MGDYVSVAELRKHKYELGLLEDDVAVDILRMDSDTFENMMFFSRDKTSVEYERGCQTFSCKYMSFIMDVMQGLGVDHYTHQPIYEDRTLQFCGKTEEDDDHHVYDDSYYEQVISKKKREIRKNIFWVSFLLKEVNRTEAYKQRLRPVFKEIHKGIKY